MRKVPRPVFMTFNHWRMGVDSPAELPAMKAMSDFQFSHIRVDNSELANTPTGIVLSGVPAHFIENISFDDVSFTSSGGGTADEAAIRDLHALNEDGMVLCNPRDKEVAHRAEMEGIATPDRAAVTCRKCLSLLYELEKARQEGR